MVMENRKEVQRIDWFVHAEPVLVPPGVKFSLPHQIWMEVWVVLFFPQKVLRQIVIL
jgi:hypothetical protein